MSTGVLTLLHSYVTGPDGSDRRWVRTGRADLLVPTTALAARLTAVPGTYLPGEQPQLVGALAPLSSGLYRGPADGPAPAGCSWVTDSLGGTDLVVQQSGVEVTKIVVPNGRVRGASGVKDVWGHDFYAMGGPTPGGTNKNPYPLVQSSFNGGTGWLVEDVSAVWDTDKRTVDSYGIHLQSGTIRRCLVEGAVDLAVIYGDDCALEANLQRNGVAFSNDPRQVDGSHSDGCQDEGGKRHRIVGNDIFSPTSGTASLIMTQNQGLYDDLLVAFNRFRGGKTFAVIGTEKGKGAFANFRYLSNIHGRESTEGQAGKAVAIFSSATYDSMTRSGNVYTDGTPMDVRVNRSQV